MYALSLLVLLFCLVESVVMVVHLPSKRGESGRQFCWSSVERVVKNVWIERTPRTDRDTADGGTSD